MATEKKYAAVLPHGGLEKISDNVFWVSGGYSMMPGVRIGCTMTIVKRGTDLTIFNSLRVSQELEEEIKKLGTIKNVVRICANHGSCDEYYIDTFGATYWDLPGAADAKGATKVPITENLLSDGDGGLPPIPEAKIILLKSIATPEAVVFLPNDGDGILICGDFIRNAEQPCLHQSFGGKAMSSLMGFNTGCCSTPSPFFFFYGKGEDIYGPNVPVILDLKFDTFVAGE